MKNGTKKYFSIEQTIWYNTPVHTHKNINLELVEQNNFSSLGEMGAQKQNVNIFNALFILFTVNVIFIRLLATQALLQKKRNHFRVQASFSVLKRYHRYRCIINAAGMNLRCSLRLCNRFIIKLLYRFDLLLLGRRL